MCITKEFETQDFLHSHASSPVSLQLPSDGKGLPEDPSSSVTREHLTARPHLHLEHSCVTHHRQCLLCAANIEFTIELEFLVGQNFPLSSSGRLSLKKKKEKKKTLFLCCVSHYRLETDTDIWTPLKAGGCLSWSQVRVLSCEGMCAPVCTMFTLEWGVVPRQWTTKVAFIVQLSGTRSLREFRLALLLRAALPNQKRSMSE